MSRTLRFDPRLGPNGKLMHELSPEAQIERWWGTVRCADALLANLDLTDAARRRWINERDAAATMIWRTLDRQAGVRPADPFARFRRVDPAPQPAMDAAPRLRAGPAAPGSPEQPRTGAGRAAKATKPGASAVRTPERPTLPEICPACLGRPSAEKCARCCLPPSGQMQLPL